MENQSTDNIDIELYKKMLAKNKKLIEVSKKWLKDNPQKARINCSNSYQKLKEQNPEKYLLLLEKKRKYYLEQKKKKLSIED